MDKSGAGNYKDASKIPERRRHTCQKFCIIIFQVKTPRADLATHDTAPPAQASGMFPSVATSVAYTPEAGTGTYYLRAKYSGDDHYRGNQSDYNAEQLTVTKSADNLLDWVALL